MEVSIVSPPPASATDGDYPCDIDITDVAIHSVMLLIGLCGLAGNGAVLYLLGFNYIALFIFNLAVADIFFLLFVVPSALLFLVEDVSCSPILPPVYVSFLFQLSVVSYYWVLFRLADISMMKGMYKLCWLFCCCHLSWRLLWLVDSALDWAFFAVITVIPTVTLLCPAQEQEHCRVALICMFAIILLLFAAPMVIFSKIIFIRAKCGSQQHQPTRHDITVFLIVFFTLFLSLWNLLQQLSYIVVSSQVVFLLACLNSSIKPFIYFLGGRCWRPCSMGSLRLSLQRVFEEQEDKTARSNVPTMDTGV